MRGSPIARHQPWLVLVCLTVFLLLLPLTLSKPGIPVFLKADEAAYYLAALSLVEDGDLVCDDGDARRLFREYAGTDNLLLMSRARGETVYFSVPFIYPAVAAPLVALFGANGMVLLNAALLMAMVWMGFVTLRRHNAPTESLLFACGFFLLSTAFVYVFWLQPEVFQMACMMGAYFLVVWGTREAAGGSGRVAHPRLVWLAAAAAALVATASYGKPMYVVLSVPLAVRLASMRSWRAAVSFAASGVLTAAALSASSYALTEQIWPYFAPRIGTGMSSPVGYIARRVDPLMPQTLDRTPADMLAKSGKELSVTLSTIVREAAPEFLIGRHGGLLVYMPFAVLAAVFFLGRDRRSLFRWLILASAIVTAVLFMTLVRGHWLGGGGFVGNRYFTAAYPCLFFLVREIRPAWLVAVGYASAGLFLGPLLITPLGVVVNEPTLQAHVRNQPFPRLPIEWSLARELAGYRYLPRADVVFHGRRDELVGRREEVWVHGAKKVEINLISTDPRRSFAFDVRNLAPDNEIELCMDGTCRTLTFDDVPSRGLRQRVVFPVQAGKRLPRAGPQAETFRYRLTVDTAWGEQPRWRGSGQERFYLGAALVYLGTAEGLERNLFDAEWLEVDAPASMVADATHALPVVVRNRSAHTWPSAGVKPVRLSYHWLRDDGTMHVRDGRRTALPDDVAAGARVAAPMRVDAPSEPGQYVLVLDLVQERVRWFATREPEKTYRVPVTVTAGEP